MAFDRYVHSLMFAVWSPPLAQDDSWGPNVSVSSVSFSGMDLPRCSIHPSTIAVFGCPRHSQSITEIHVVREAALHLSKQRSCLEAVLILRLPSVFSLFSLSYFLSPLYLSLFPSTIEQRSAAPVWTLTKIGIARAFNLDDWLVTSRETDLEFWKIILGVYDTEFEVLPAPCLVDSRTVRDASQFPHLCIETCVFQPGGGRSCGDGPSNYLEMLPFQSDGLASVQTDPQMLASF